MAYLQLTCNTLDYIEALNVLALGLRPELRCLTHPLVENLLHSNFTDIALN